MNQGLLVRVRGSTVAWKKIQVAVNMSYEKADHF
jgi:hypothetical protein